MNAEFISRLIQIEEAIWELPQTYRKKMRVPVRVVATKKLLTEMDDGAIDQAVNVAQLPGIVGASWIMPDGHWGYGMPVGGVAAFSLEDGVISPGAVGFDINCGMRLIVTNLTEAEVKPRIETLVDKLFDSVPTGVGARGFIRLSRDEFEEIMIKGARWAVEKGLGWERDIDAMEENGSIKEANPGVISDRALKRGINQLGTLGSGNHYLEIQKVEKIFDLKTAEERGIKEIGQVVIMIHCGSRGFGHQVATDYLNDFARKMEKYGIEVADNQLACLPMSSPEGGEYYSAMAAAANNAFCNRQVIMHRVREVFEHIFATKSENLDMRLVYDVAHNIAKIEEYKIQNQNGKKQKVVVHRKGATRAFPDQPVIIGGSMETGSYLLIGTQGAIEKTFGSTAHGSGRKMSRTKAKKSVQGKSLQEQMKSRGIYVKSASYSGLAEEAGFAYKDIAEVVKAVSLADISQPVASFKPLGNIKG